MFIVIVFYCIRAHSERQECLALVAGDSDNVQLFDAEKGESEGERGGVRSLRGEGARGEGTTGGAGAKNKEAGAATHYLEYVHRKSE